MLRVVVIITAAIINFSDKLDMADAICCYFFATVVIVTSYPIGKNCLYTLMEGAPLAFNLNMLRVDIL